MLSQGQTVSRAPRQASTRSKEGTRTGRFPDNNGTKSKNSTGKIPRNPTNILEIKQHTSK